MPLPLTIPADDAGAEYIVRPGMITTLPSGARRRVWRLMFRAAPHLGAACEGRIYLDPEATERDAADRFGVLNLD